MIRKAIQSALCVCLSPLLAAQQAAAISSPSAVMAPASSASPIPKGVRAELAVVDPEALASARDGTPIRFTVMHEVTANGAVAIPKGTEVAGVITDARSGSYVLSSSGRLTIHARDLRAGTPIKVHLKGRRHAGAAGYSAWGGSAIGSRDAIIVLGICAFFAILSLTAQHSH